MAQRFAIDGNFTQSFVGTVSLNAQACPSNNSEDFASLFYDLDTGTVCYITSSTDFCYEFFFDNESTNLISKGGAGVKAQPPAQSFQFVGDPNPPPLGATNWSAPKDSLTNTKFLMFDSSSANAGSLLNYLIQNTESGSIKLSTTTQAVEINYTTQAQTGSLGNNKIIIGNSNNIPAFSSSSFTVLTTTSDTPFTHGERVCVEVNSAGGGGSSTTYQTGSDATKVSLTNLKVIDYDNNVYLTSNPITGELTLQFGTPSLPSISAFTVPTTTTQGNTSFNTDRFTGTTAAHTSLYVVDDDYRMLFTYVTESSNTFLSASILADVNGTETEIINTSTYGEGSSQTFNINGTTHEDYFHSGSHTFKGAVNVILEDGSHSQVTSSGVAVTLNKLNPDTPSYNITYDVLGDSAYISNTGDNTTNINIEMGATGSAVHYGTYGASDKGWTRTSITPDPGSPTTLTITTTSGTDFTDVVSNYSSNSLGNPPTTSITVDKDVTRITSLRYGAFPASHFSSDLSPTEAELLDILNWTNNGGTVVFQTNSSGEINEYEFDLTYSGDKYLYVIVDDAITLSEINNDGFGSIGAYTSGTTTNYKFYVTTDIQSGAGGKTVAFKLFT